MMAFYRYCVIVASVFLSLLVLVHCTIFVDYEGLACPGSNTVTCQGQSDSSVDWFTSVLLPSGNSELTGDGFLPPTEILNETSTVSGTFSSSFFESEITVTFIPLNQTAGLFAFNTTYTLNTTLQTTLTCGNGSGNTIGEVTIEFASIPSSPVNVMQVSEQGLINSVIVTIRWDPPTDNGGRADLTYTVTISQPSQPAASTITTLTTANVTAQYEEINTISVVAMNCIGSSPPVTYIYRIDGCPIPTAPVSGTIGPVTSRAPGSKVTFQCDPGFTPTVRMVATCLVNSLVWNPDPAMFVCNPAQGIDPLSAQSFTGLDVTLSVVVSAVLSVVIGIVIGACGTYLIIRKKTPAEKTAPLSPKRISSPVEEIPPSLPPPRQGHVFYPPVSSSDVELEENYAYMRSTDFL